MFKSCKNRHFAPKFSAWRVASNVQHLFLRANYFLESDVSLILYFNMLILLCPFCLKGFEPLLNCKLSSCKHVFHGSCAFSQIFPLFQNVCIVRKKITQIGGHFLESRSLILKKRRQRKHIPGKIKLHDSIFSLFGLVLI
jgi:hypothetical protein